MHLAAAVGAGLQICDALHALDAPGAGLLVISAALRCAAAAMEGHGRLTGTGWDWLVGWLAGWLSDWWLDGPKRCASQSKGLVLSGPPSDMHLELSVCCLGDEDGRQGPRDALSDSSAPVSICTRRDSIEFV